VPLTTNLTWTSDGRIIDDRDNNLHWTNVDSGAKGLLSTQSDSANGDPWACADGHYVVFLSGLRGGAGTLNVWRADISGGNLKQLSSDKTEYDPVCSPDSKWVYYLEGGTGKLWRVPIEGGASQKVSDLGAEGWADISPDGATAAFATVDHAAGHQVKIALIDTITGNARAMLAFERQRVTSIMRFSRDGKALIYTIRANGVDNLWQQPLDGSAGKQLTSFKAEHIWDFHWSPDGSKLALVRGHTDADVVLMRDMQQ
jgi:Tol biopolymer transport system component